MADDPYVTLGVARTATDKQIRAAFLKIAKTSHPDLNPGDPKAEERFKAANAAHDLLSDPDRRARFDRGEIDGAGHEAAPPRPDPRAYTQQGGYRAHAEGPSGAFYNTGFGESGDPDMGDILSGLFGNRGRGRAHRGGADRHYTLMVPFLDAINGSTQRLAQPDGSRLDVKIPAGLETGQTLRLRGKGDPGEPAGDALIEVEVAAHKLFHRTGRDVTLDLPITVAEAVLGAKVTVPTIDGTVTMKIPAGSESGTKLRLRGKGVPASASLPVGDGYAILRIVLGPADEGLASFLRDRTDAPVWDPRAALEKLT